jgi:spermidine/putrescine-binding protein
MEVTSTEVNLFTWAEYIPQEVIDCFQEVYGVQLHLDNFSSQEEMYAKMTKGATGYDVVQPADNFVQLMIQKGMLAKLDQSKLTVMNNFGAEFLNPPFDPGCQYSLPYQLGSSGIAYNSETITTAPTSYADLWNSEYAGKLVMLDDSRNIIGMTLLSLGYDVNTTDPAQLAEAKAKLIELVPNIRIFDSDSPKSALIAGDVDLGVVWATEGFAANLEKPSIQYVYPKEGVILWQDNFSITIDAAHLDAAYAWLNYLYQPDVFWMVMRDFSGVNPETAAIEYAKTNQPDVYAAYMESNITNIPADVVTNGHWLQDLGEATPLFDQLWTEVKGQ